MKLLLFLLVVALVCSAGLAQDKPNVVLIVADDKYQDTLPTHD